MSGQGEMVYNGGRYVATFCTEGGEGGEGGRGGREGGREGGKEGRREREWEGEREGTLRLLLLTGSKFSDFGVSLIPIQ